METIYHQLLIDAPRTKKHEAITTQQGLAGWWIANCVAKPEVRFMNTFRVGEDVYNKMEVRALAPDPFVAWKYLNENDVWSDTEVSFALSKKGDFTYLDFKHSGYRQHDGVYATCNYHWARHLSISRSSAKQVNPS